MGASFWKKKMCEELEKTLFFLLSKIISIIFYLLLMLDLDSDNKI